MSRIFTSTILFNKSTHSGGAAFMEERRSQSNGSSTATSESSDTPSPEIDPKAMFDSYMSEFQEESTPNTDSAEEDGKWNPLSSFHVYLDALEKEPDLYHIVTDGIKELRERVQFTENEYKEYYDEDFSLTAYDISLKKSEYSPENVYESSSKFDILYILLNWMQEAGVRGDCSHNDAYPLTVIQNEDISYIWSVMIFKDGTLKECSIGPGRDNEETSINYRSIEDIQIEIANKPFQFSNSKSETIIKIGNLEVLTEIGDMAWKDAKNACVELGDRWRLPTKDEFKVIHENRDKISRKLEINPYYYWTSEEGQYEGMDGYAWNHNFLDNKMVVSLKFAERGVLAVREATAMNESSSQQSSDESEEMVSLDDVLKNAAAARAAKESSSQQPSFPPLTAEAIKFIDEACVENGINANSTVDDVEEIWDDLVWDFGVADECNSDEEREKIAKAFADYMAYKRTQF
jgi:hypothetical protein